MSDRTIPAPEVDGELHAFAHGVRVMYGDDRVMLCQAAEVEPGFRVGIHSRLTVEAVDALISDLTLAKSVALTPPDQR